MFKLYLYEVELQKRYQMLLFYFFNTFSLVLRNFQSNVPANVVRYLNMKQFERCPNQHLDGNNSLFHDGYCGLLKEKLAQKKNALLVELVTTGTHKTGDKESK